uniref:Uncharacterized protein n=1 Tax=Oryza punctata TaxID=4537 RepID=A0A0E0M4Z8_ORYPU
MNPFNCRPIYKAGYSQSGVWNKILAALVTMETTDDQERAPLLHPQPHPQVFAANSFADLLQEDAGSEFTGDGSVDINNQPALKRKTGNWRACFMILGVELSECLGFYGISKNLVTYLTKFLHESKVNAAKNTSAWYGSCYLTPLLGAFLPNTYWGRYCTTLTFLTLYIDCGIIKFKKTTAD